MFLLNVTALFVRVLGVYLLLKIVIQHRGLSSSLAAVGEDSSLLYLLTPGSVILSLVALAMIYFPVSIARMLIPKTSSESPSLGDGARALEICAYTVMGVYILSWALPDLVEKVVYVVLAAQTPSPLSEEDRTGLYVSMGVTLLEIAIGAFLALRAVTVSSLVMAIRSYGSASEK